MNIITQRTEGLETQSAEESPFCQLMNRDISGAQCLDMQGQPGCFGCASTSRLCEVCSLRRVDVPAVGLCGSCIISELEKEKELSIPTNHDKGTVGCQITKRDIRIAMCLATQGDDRCQGCSASSRICEKCKQRPSRFPRYGLCLACSIQEYGDGWDPAEFVAKPEPTSPHCPSVKIEEPVRLIPAEGNKGSILVVGADVSRFEGHMLRDPRIRHWSARDVHEDRVIPEGTEKVVCCAPEIKRAKNTLLQKLIAMARAEGRHVQFYEVHHQGRLREVLGNELKYNLATPGESQSEAQKAKGATIMEPAAIAPVLEPHPAQAAPTPSVPTRNVIHEGGDEVKTNKSINQIVAENYDATNADTDALLGIVRKSHPDAQRHSIHSATWLVRKSRGVTAKSNSGSARTAKPRKFRARRTEPVTEQLESSLGKRVAQALQKIEEGLAELQVLSPQLEDVDARLKRLVLFEAAMRQVNEKIRS